MPGEILKSPGLKYLNMLFSTKVNVPVAPAELGTLNINRYAEGGHFVVIKDTLKIGTTKKLVVPSYILY